MYMTNAETTYTFKQYILQDCLMSPLDGITRVIADSDLDGLIAAAILVSGKPDLEVHFAHPAILRAGSLDHLINRQTALCDLPFHPNCGLYLDHHMTNKPSLEIEKQFIAAGGICVWRDTPSAARAAYDFMKNELDLSHLEEIMPIVDELDSGGISYDDFMLDGPVLRLSRSLSLTEPEHLQTVMKQFSLGLPLDDILESHKDRLENLKNERNYLESVVKKNTVIIDRMAICDLSENEIRSNGYLITALTGDEVLACCVIHGYLDGTIDNPDRPALGASFYANSFRSEENRFDLSKLATALDSTGGGHANACGCRIQARDSSIGKLTQLDKRYNIEKWLELWADREIKLLKN